MLRLVDRPLTNVEATGITTDVVEAMEVNLKKDIERETIQFEGRVLLHDEVETQPGSFDITAQSVVIFVRALHHSTFCPRV